MKTPEEINKGLKCCVGDILDCKECPYLDDECCMYRVKHDAYMRIQQLEEQIMGMKIQMHGDCGVCKHRSGCQIDGRDIAMSKTCYECMMKESRPNWEYEGLPELPKKGE